MNISLIDVFKKSFGYEPTIENLNKFSIEKAQDRINYSRLGLPYYGADEFDREFFLPVYLDDIIVPFAVVGMNWKKTIVSTPLQSRKGSAKEIICTDDFQFNIKGLILENEFDFPENGIVKLHDIFKKDKSIEMRSVISDIVLNGKGNDRSDAGMRVIIKEIKFPAVSGIEHAKPFEMDLVSDQIYSLLFVEKKSSFRG